MLISQTLLIFLTLRVPVVSFQCNSYHLLCNGHKYILLGRKYIKTPANEPFYCYKNHYVMSSCWRLNPCFSLWKPNDELFRISFTYSNPNWRNKHFDLLEYRILRKNISSVDIAMSKMDISPPQKIMIRLNNFNTSFTSENQTFLNYWRHQVYLKLKVVMK